MRRKFLAGVVMFCAIVFLSTPVIAAFTNVVTFGDSISDNGFSMPPAPDIYGIMTFTDGPTWADQLAGLHGASMFNVAFGGATTGTGNLYPTYTGTGIAPFWDLGFDPDFDSADTTDWTGLNWQVSNPRIQAQIGGMPLDTTLFTVWAGANDYNSLADTATAGDKLVAALTAVDNIMTALGTLAGIGAEHILVPNLMVLGDGSFSLPYNDALAAGLAAFDETFAGTLYTVDMFTLYLELFAGYDPASEEDIARAIENGLLWQDGYHPGSVAQTAMADAAFQATVPVPGALLLMASGLVSLAGFKRRKAA